MKNLILAALLALGPSCLAVDDSEKSCAELLISDVQAVLGVAQWIKKHKTVPDIQDLAIQLRTNVEAVEAYLGTAEGGPKTIADLVTKARDQFPEYFAGIQKSLAKEITAYYRSTLTLPTHTQLGEFFGISDKEVVLLTGTTDEDKSLMEFADRRFPNEFAKLRNRVAKAYARVSKDRGRNAQPEEVSKFLAYPPEALGNALGPTGLFANTGKVKNLAEILSPKSFARVINTDKFDQAYLDKAVEALQTSETIIFTTAMADDPIHQEAFDALLNLAKIKKAPIFVFPADMQTTGLDPIFLNTEGVYVITHSTELSPWLAFDNIKLIPKQIYPLMGLDRLGKLGQSIIVGSPKMHVRTLPSKSTQNPKKLLTTGGITSGFYAGEKYISGRTDRIASEDHVVGALLLEKRKGISDFVDVESAGHFFARHLEFIPEENGFVDLDILYTAKAQRKVAPKAVVLGDIHVGMTDERLMKGVREQILTLKPEVVVLHDLFDGRSINHHEEKRLLTLAAKADKGLLDLQYELDMVRAFINSILNIDPSITILVVPSNHDAWLHGWLESGQFMRENQNRSLGLRLAQLKVEGKDVFEEAVLEGMEAGKRKRVNFLRRGRDFRVGPDHRQVELGQHGDKGANGSKGSVRGLLVAFKRIVFGHTHTDSRLNGAVNVSTLTLNPMPYSSEGTSNWSQSLALVNPFGGIQILESFDGSWYSNPEDLKTTPERFFWPGYPNVIPNTPGPRRQVDQYGGR